MKYFCVQIHTEKLHDDNVWRQVQKILDYFSKNNIQATWFSINPTFVGYQAMQFDEGKWIERLKIIKSFGQDIQQHTHFYKGKEGIPKGEGYDMAGDHIEKRLREDRKWLEERGFPIDGFVSGAWAINDDLFQTLGDLNYKYDSSIKGREKGSKFGVLEIPVTSKVRKLYKDAVRFRLGRSFLDMSGHKICVVSFHDYDLGSARFRIALTLVLVIFRMAHFDFINTSTMYGIFKPQK